MLVVSAGFVAGGEQVEVGLAGQSGAGQVEGRVCIKARPRADGLPCRTLTFYSVPVGRGWEVILEPEVSDWILGLPDDTYDRVEAAIDMLAQSGPGLGGHWSTRSPVAGTRT